MFWVILVYFNIRNTLPKFCPFLLGHPVYIYIYIYIYIYTQICTAGCNSYLLPSDFIAAEVIVMARPNPILKLCNIGKMPPFHILILPWEQKSRKERGWACRGGGTQPTNLILAKGKHFVNMQRFNENHRWPLTAFPLKIFDDVSSSGSSAGIFYPVTGGVL